MKTVFFAIALAVLMVGCSTTPVSSGRHDRCIKGARITWYDNHEDKWGSQTSSGRRACEGRTVAAHPDFDFGTRLRIPALAPIFGHEDFVIEDRGGAVKRKRAATHGEYVFDIYLWAKSHRIGTQRIKQLGSSLTHADVFIE